MKRFNTLLVSLASIGLSCEVFAASSFVIQKIQINGLHRITQGTVLNYLPVQVGDSISDAETTQIITALYKTGFFSDVSLERQGNTLIVNVQERPTIGSIIIKGNKLINTKDLTTGLSNLGVATGQVYNQSIIDGITQSLQRQYYEQGNYGAKVVTHVNTDSENRVNIEIIIQEGDAAKIRQIKIIGNQTFSQKELLKQFKLTTPRLWDAFTKTSQYSSQKLDGDIEALKSYYMDRGYIAFKVDSTQVVLSPDKKDVDIIIHITEGAQYTLKDYNFEGTLIFPESTLRKVVRLVPGQIFSRKQITNTATALTDYYGRFGYAFAKVQPMPHIDTENKQVTMTFLIDPGKKVYVRRINIAGNTKTQDTVIRREMRQPEGALLNSTNINESQRRLNMLGYFKDAKIDTVPVPGTDDQVDLNVGVTEAPSATLTLGAGYSDTDGILINAGFNQPNFLGTGKNLGISFNTSDFQRYYNVSYFNPYYTDDGIGRGFNVYAETTNTDAHNIDISTYATDSYGASMNYSVPMSEKNSLSFGYGYEITRLKLGNNPSSELINFMNDTNTLPLPAGTQPDHKSQTYNNVTLNGGWSHINLDRGIFPTKGFANTFGVEVAVPGGNTPENYYKANYNVHWYEPIFGSNFIFTTRGALGYGSGFGSTKNLPFYENYYAGGIGNIGQVRGYEGYSIGPQDSNRDSYGGNALVDGSVGLVIPTPIAPDTFRTTAFVDFGNVYNTTGVKTTIGSGPMRFAAGVSAEWRSPIGPLILSIAEPLNLQPQDRREVLQFTVGTSF